MESMSATFAALLPARSCADIEANKSTPQQTPIGSFRYRRHSLFPALREAIRC